MNNNLENLKVGDEVWLKGNVLDVECSDLYPIKVNFQGMDVNLSFTKDGKFKTYNTSESLFTNPLEQNKGYWAMVSDYPIDEENKGQKRFVFMRKNEMFIAWTDAETDEEVNNAFCVAAWEYAQKIEEPKQIELTLEQIADKFGIDVSLLKIKK